MPRTLTSGVSTAIAAPHAEFVHFVELAFSGGTQRLSTGDTSMPWNGQTWTAIGGALAINTVTETADLAGEGLELTLSGVDQSILAVLLSQLYIGRAAKVWLVHLNPTAGTIIADPLEIFRGFMNGGWTVRENRDESGSLGTVTVSGRCVSRLAALNATRGMQSNLTSHQSLYGVDRFFEHVPSLATKRVVWSR